MPGGGAWVADAANDRLLRLAPDGGIAQTLGAPGSGDGQLAEPRGLKLRAARRAARPAPRLGTIAASGQRSCTLAVSEATVGVLSRGRVRSYTATAKDGVQDTAAVTWTSVEDPRFAALEATLRRPPRV